MNSPLLWTLIVFQLAMGLFDIVYHHELTERLAWRPSQQHDQIHRTSVPRGHQLLQALQGRLGIPGRSRL